MEFEEFKMAKKEKNTFQNTGLYSLYLHCFSAFLFAFGSHFPELCFEFFSLESREIRMQMNSFGRRRRGEGFVRCFLFLTFEIRL